MTVAIGHICLCHSLSIYLITNVFSINTEQPNTYENRQVCDNNFYCIYEKLAKSYLTFLFEGVHFLY